MNSQDRHGSLMIVGGQWGDEGKGKLVDLLSAGFPVVVRYNGGHNAGHTVRFGDHRFALHLIPSGIIHPSVQCYLASGMVVDPRALIAEIDRLASEGIECETRIFLSPRASLILPTHCALDNAREKARGSSAIGTTGRGIGPTYEDLARRRVLRAHLFADPDRFEAAVRELMAEHNRELTLLYDAEAVDIDAAIAELRPAAERLAPMLRETGPEIARHRGLGKPVLFEGAQGILLDQCFGTYPYVTSSCCLPASAAASCGIGTRLLGPVVGIMKAYVTRVGGGPFPSELENEIGEEIRRRGDEFGTTTGRPRRCGWFDAVAARFAVEAAGMDAVVLTKLDVLDTLDTLGLVTGYRMPDGRVLDTMPADAEDVAVIEPIVEEFPGWKQSTVGLTDENAMPETALAYVAKLEELMGVPVVIISTGPRREETIFRSNTTLARQLSEFAASRS